MLSRYVMVFVCLNLACRTCVAAEDESLVSAEDVRSLKLQEQRIDSMIPWHDGIAFNAEGRWWTTKPWPLLESEPFKAPNGDAVSSLYQSKGDHYIVTHVANKFRMFRQNDAAWEEVQLPAEVSNADESHLVPRDQGLAFAVGSMIFWQKEGRWRTTKVTRLPAWRMRNEHPIGETMFIQHDFLYSSSYGGEFGSSFASYELAYNEGSWQMTWRNGLPVVRLFEDRKGTLWAFAVLGHMGRYSYSLSRRNPRWDQVIENSTRAHLAPIGRPSPSTLQDDSLLCDAAPMPDGRIALLDEADGVYLKSAGNCPRYIKFDPELLGSKDRLTTERQRLCFDSTGNVYLTSANRGVLVFHKDDKGLWRVRQLSLRESSLD